MSVQAWAASVAVAEDDERGATRDLWRMDRVLSEWPRAIESAQINIMTEKTSLRTKFLREDVLSLLRSSSASIGLPQALDVFDLLTKTYPRYVDRASRNAAEQVLLELIRLDAKGEHAKDSSVTSPFKVVQKVLDWLANEAGGILSRGSSSSCAPADVYVLLCWTCTLYQACFDIDPEFHASRPYAVLVDVLAKLSDFMLNDSVRAKASLRESALVRTRRALRSSPGKVSVLIDTLLTQTFSSQAPLIYVPLLGIAVGVTLRLKHKDTAIPQTSSATKENMLKLYTEFVLSCKSPIPPHITRAMHEFVHEFVLPEHFIGVVLPAMEKALLRFPEYSLSVASRFFEAYAHPLDDASFRRLMTPLLANSKSTNSLITNACVELFGTCLGARSTSSILELAVTELLNLPKSGRSGGPSHRVVLYSMLAYIPAASSTSATIVRVAVPLLVKETHEGAMTILASLLPAHIGFLLDSSSPLPAEITSQIAAEMNNSKHPIRRAFYSMIGTTFWHLTNPRSEASLALAGALSPCFETSLKTASATPLNLIAGPLEAYVALVSLMEPYLQSDQSDGTLNNVADQSLRASSTRPSFLLWDKVYQKISAAEEQIWLLRASEVALQFLRNDLTKNESLRGQIGMVFLHLAVDGQSRAVREAALTSLEKSVKQWPSLIHSVIRQALNLYLSKVKPTNNALEDEATADKHDRLTGFLLSSAAFGEDDDLSTRESLVADLIIPSHHTLISSRFRQTWIDLCRKARIDPYRLVNRNVDKLLEIVIAASAAGSPDLIDASNHAVRTLAFVSPEVFIPRVVAHLQVDLNAARLNSLTDLELGIWAAPSTTTYVDVLASRKGAPNQTKGKDRDIEKWEAEVRKSLARKGSSSVSLSQQERALVQAQLEKEALIRSNVESLRSNLQRGLRFIEALISANVPALQRHMPSISSLLLEGALGAQGSALIGQNAFDVYVELSKCCSERLDAFRKWVGVATVRTLKDFAVPESLRAEPLHDLVTRVLYRLHSHAERTPFDAATFSYAFPLLAEVINRGGVKSGGDEDPLEQISLALEVIKSHRGEFGNLAFPRLKTIQCLPHIIGQYPQLSKNASSVLVDVSEALHENASRSEIDVLLHGTLSQEVYVRNSCLHALQPLDLTDRDWSSELWLAVHDEDEHNALIASQVWEDNGLDIPDTFLPYLLVFLDHDNDYVRKASSVAIARGVSIWPQGVHAALRSLQAIYRERAKILAPELDEYGMVIAQVVERSNPRPARLAIAVTLRLLAPSFEDSDVVPLFEFLIRDEALGDGASDVRREMLMAGIAVIDALDSTRLADLFNMFEGHLSAPSPATETADHIKEGVVILLGAAARHLEPTDPRIPTVISRLVEALKTPSEQVQLAVSDCLAPLLEFMRSGAGQLADQLFDQLFNADKYAARLGAAYGLAGIVKGVGILGMKEFNFVHRLRAATEEKKRYECRQGAMFALETLSKALGRLFEPYVTVFLPLLLTSFGDSTADVREAAQDAARAIMGNLSGYGVKLMMPSLLPGLEEKQWRTKKGSIELLGTMAYCSPRQLSLSLPIVIPRLTGVLTDSHAQVRTSANKSLKQFGEVISNPEIQSLVPVLLKALANPDKTTNALTSLLNTPFMHYIDRSSLALVVPIIERGLRERGSDTKRKAVQIVGNLASLTDSRDFVPYLSQLLPLVHTVLADPVPEARATAAKALGTLVERLGEIHFPDLVPGLLRILKADASGVDRQGAAQGLSEVLSGLGVERLEGLLPDVITNAQSPRSTVREGFMSLLVYLPTTFGTRFQPHLPKIIGPILNGLADSEESVREAAMRAGRMVVSNFSTKAIDLLLPELENGIFDSSWRIRHSSITLVGELLYKISGISGKTDIEEEEVNVDVSENSRRALVDVLGAERRNRILSSVFLARQDGVNTVRQSSIQIWKALVHNTPRTVREMLSELLDQIIFLISSEDFEQQETAARTTLELCRKFGEKTFAEMIPILKAKSASFDPRTREGVCLAICQIMEGINHSQREGHEDEIITMVRISLVDDEANVRAAAARAFDVLQELLGTRAIDQTIPTLLEALRQPGKSSGTALQALKEVMTVRAATVFPILIPTLTATPMTVFNARALASLVTVAGSALTKRLNAILSALVGVLETGNLRDDLAEAVDEALRALCASIDDAEGLHGLMLILLSWAKHHTPERRVCACNIFATFCQQSQLDWSLYRVDWIRQIVSLLEDRETSVRSAAADAFDVFVRSIPKDQYESLVVPLRRSIESTGGPGTHVAGFSLPKGVSPTVPIIIAGLITGSNEQREQAAYAIGDLVERTEESAIKPFVVPFTGPLIRVATQATTYPPPVKIAILTALTVMLKKIPAFVKPFFPQLQRTFVKSAGDAASIVARTKAAQALGVLMRNQPRVDPVVTELIAGIKSNEEPIAGSLVLALANVIGGAGDNVGDKAREACADLLSNAFQENHEEKYIQSMAALAASLAQYPQMLDSIVQAHLVDGTVPSVLASHVTLALLTIPDGLEDDPVDNVIYALPLRRIALKLQESIAIANPSIARPAREARELLKKLSDAQLQDVL